MKSEENEIEKMAPGPVLNALVQAEIFGAIPLSNEEWKIFRATYAMTQGQHNAQAVARPVKIPLDKPEWYTKLDFCLAWPSDYSGDAFGCSRELINKMRADGWLFELSDTGAQEKDRLKRARFSKRQNGLMFLCEGEALAETDAHAICKAALKAVRALKVAEMSGLIMKVVKDHVLPTLPDGMKKLIDQR